MNLVNPPDDEKKKVFLKALKQSNLEISSFYLSSELYISWIQVGDFILKI